MGRDNVFVNQVIHGDCLEVMPQIPPHSVDMILCDLPYGTTACAWDVIITFSFLWEEYKRVIKENGAIVLTASQPFTSLLVMSNIEMFRYELIWEKTNSTAHMMANIRPMKCHENILVFYHKQPTYNPQMEQGKPYVWNSQRTKSEHFADLKKNDPIYNEGERYPRSVKKFTQERGFHPTQKPVSLFEYLIKTYTNEGEIVLDNCAGSGTTGIACKQVGRKYILIEKEEEYISVIKERLRNVQRKIL